MKFKELSKMSKQELESKLNEIKLDLMKQNAQVATGTTPQNPGQIKVKKKTIARIMSLIDSEDKKI